MSQNALILNYLQKGRKLSPLVALRLFNCWALSSRASDLKKKGHKIKSEMIKKNGKFYAEYSL